MQNWSCHNCGGCCREHQIAITSDEKRRIESQSWTAADGIPTDRPMIVPMRGGWSLNHQADGACVFLDERGLCRIHTKFGEPAKPLACRLYPYAIHPAGANVTASLRFSCPSVTQNLGRAVTQQRAEIEQLAAEVVPANFRTMPSPPLTSTKSLPDWSQVALITSWLQRGMADDKVDFCTRLQRTLAWTSLLENAPSESLTLEHLGTLLKLLYETGTRAIPAGSTVDAQPSRIARLMFRQFVAQLLRHDTALTVRSGLTGRIRLLFNGLRFTFGIGRVPEQRDPISVSVAFRESSPKAGATDHTASGRPRFRELEVPHGGRQREIDELLTRYVLVKLEGMHYCGSAFYGMPVIDGFRSLALMTAAVYWVARFRARRGGRGQVTLADAQAALATVDHNYGYSPVLGMRASLSRIRQLAKLDQLATLCSWYSS